MNAHPRMGLGPEMTADDFAAAGRAEFVRLIIWDMTSSGKAKDPETAQKWFHGRPGIDRETRIQVLQTLFPPRRNASKRVRFCDPAPMRVAANHA
jgi:hypothetical protein